MKKTYIFQSVAITAVMLIGSFAISATSQAKTLLEPEKAHAVLGEYFKKYNAKGTIVILDKRGNKAKTLVYNHKRAQQRYSPASTYKIPHSLFALDAGLVNDEFQVFPWDGVKRGYAPHNQDQNVYQFD